MYLKILVGLALSFCFFLPFFIEWFILDIIFEHI